MPDPSLQQPDPARFPGAVLQRLRDLQEFEQAEQFARRPLDLSAVHSALLELTAEVRQLRAAIEPSSSPIVHGTEAVRAFRELKEQR